MLLTCICLHSGNDKNQHNKEHVGVCNVYFFLGRQEVHNENTHNEWKYTKDKYCMLQQYLEISQIFAGHMKGNFAILNKTKQKYKKIKFHQESPLRHNIFL